MIQPVKRSGKTNHQAPFGLGSIARKGHAATCRAKNQMGFLLSDRTPHESKGLYGLRGRKQPRPNRWGLFGGAIPSTEQAWFNSWGRGRLTDASHDTAQVNQSTLYPFNGVGGGFAVNLINS